MAARQRRPLVGSRDGAWGISPGFHTRFIVLWHALQLRCGPLALQRFVLRPVEAHGHEEGTLGRREPIGLLVLTRGVILNPQHQPAIGIALELRQHWRVEQVAVDRIGVEKTRRPLQQRVRRQCFSSQRLRLMGFTRELCCPSCWASPMRIPSGPRM